jgi:ornithine carbamoyltransferase
MPATLTTSAAGQTKAQDLTSDLDLSREEVLYLLDLALKVKSGPNRYATGLSGRYVTLLFEKPSLRTRLTFELAIKQLGGDCVSSIGPIGDREPLKDVARNLERWTNGIVARTFSQQTIDELAKWSRVPVINALSDLYHPCQILADLFTVKEKLGRLKGVKLAFVGDGNNVAHSLMLSASRLGMSFALAHPRAYAPNPDIVKQAQQFAQEDQASVTITDNPAEAVSGAHVVYTDVWASMGQEEEAAQRRQAFQPYQVNESLMAKALPEAIFMHCLPAKRGEETTDGVMEAENSVVFDQAENRLHAQKALLLMMLG